MERHSNKEIARELNLLNERTGLRFSDEHAYGQPRLVIQRGPGESDISYRVNKNEFYRTLYAINKVLDEMERNKIIFLVKYEFP